MGDPQLDRSLTPMDWLYGISANKLILNPVPTVTKCLNTASSNTNENFIFNKFQENTDIMKEQQNITSPGASRLVQGFAQRAEPNRPIDLHAKYNGGDHGRREGKPPYSYVNLITFAINSTSKKRMTLNEIYQWIAENFNYYKNAGNGWKV